MTMMQDNEERDINDVQPEVRGSIYQQRVCIVSSKARKLLSQMAKTGRHLDKSEFATLLSELRKGNLHTLVPLLTYLREDIMVIADPFADLFRNVAKASSATGLVQMSGSDRNSVRGRRIASKFCKKDEISSEELELLLKVAPCIAHVIAFCLKQDSKQSSIVDSSRNLVSELVRISNIPYECETHSYEEPTAQKVSGVCEAFQRDFFPSWSLQRRYL